MDFTDIHNLKLFLPEFAISDLSNSPKLLNYISKITYTKEPSNVIIYIKYNQNTKRLYDYIQDSITSINNPIIYNKDNWSEITNKTTIQSIRKFLGDDNDTCVICLETNMNGQMCSKCGSSMCIECSRKQGFLDFTRGNTTTQCPVCRNTTDLMLRISV
jgi:hypothetical protein